jgi:primary-amine oxidase
MKQPVFALMFASAVFSAYGQSPAHPLDGLTTAEYWSAYDALQAAGNLTPETLFASVLLHPPNKTAVLAWQPGQNFPRQADVVLLREGRSFAATIDLKARRVQSFSELKGVQAPFVSSELFGTDEAIKKDARIVTALKKRGITDLRTVSCNSLPTAYRAHPDQATRRIGLGSCSQEHGVYHSWGRSIEGLTFWMDMASKTILSVTDTEVAPISKGDTNYEEIPENARPNSTPIHTVQTMGPGFRIDKGEVFWQDWRFRFRLDPRVGPVLNLIRFVDHGRPRSIVYEANVSELFVPYMDPANGWNNRAFIDAGEFFSSVGFLKPLKPGLDCPAAAAWFPAITVSETGSPVLNDNLACLFERNLDNPAWRHFESNTVYGRPSRELVLRTAAAIGNYDYILDWRFSPDGTIEAAVGATGVIETKSTAETKAMDHMMASTGQLVAENLIGINHDHYFSYRLDMDVDGVDNTFMLHRMVERKITGDPMRKSIWVVEPSVARREKDAILDIQLERPSMWMFMNPKSTGPLNHAASYEIMPGANAKSLMSADDPTQKAGAFSEHQFWVTPYRDNERYASGTYVTNTDATDGLPAWTQANRSIENTDLVGWYTLGFHHITRAEDWPVMPTMWHSFQIRPFHFFEKNPVLDLPKSLDARP